MKKTFLVVTVFLIAFVCVASLLLWNRPAITEDEALKIAQVCVNAKYGDQFEGHSSQAVLIDGIWHVFYHAESTDDGFTLGGGTPEVKIRADGGRVISCLLQK